MEKRQFSPLILMVSPRKSYDKTLQNICLIQKVDSKWSHGHSCDHVTAGVSTQMINNSKILIISYL